MNSITNSKRIITFSIFIINLDNFTIIILYIINELYNNRFNNDIFMLQFKKR